MNIQITSPEQKLKGDLQIGDGSRLRHRRILNSPLPPNTSRATSGKFPSAKAFES